MPDIGSVPPDVAPLPVWGRAASSPLARLYASGDVHRLVPARLALALAPAFGNPDPKHPRRDELRQAERVMTDLLQHTPRASEAKAWAHRAVAELTRLRELFWRPWLLRRSRIIGREHWWASHDRGDGCVIVMSHLGPWYAVPRILAQSGMPLFFVGSPNYWQPLPDGYAGLVLSHVRDQYAATVGPGRLISSTARPGLLVELLERGESVGIAFDVLGSAATPFLGRSVALSGGPATLAFRTGARVLPVLPERHGTRIDLRMFEPLDPGDFPSLPSLRAEIARVFEQEVLARPDIVDVTYDPQPLVTEALVSQDRWSALDSVA